MIRFCCTACDAYRFTVVLVTKTSHRYHVPMNYTYNGTKELFENRSVMTVVNSSVNGTYVEGEGLVGGVQFTLPIKGNSHSDVDYQCRLKARGMRDACTDDACVDDACATHA